jgi:hypothetical protein
MTIQRQQIGSVHRPIRAALSLVLLAVQVLRGDSGKLGKPESMLLDHQINVSGAMLMLFTSLELLLKQAIIEVDWQLVFAKPAQVDRSKFESGLFESITFATCIVLLGSLKGMDLRTRHRWLLTRVRNQRNRTVHYGSELIREEALEMAVEIVEFICLDFFQNIYDRQRLEGDEFALMATIMEETEYFEAYRHKRDAKTNTFVVKVRMKRLLWICPYCYTQAFLYQRTRGQCLRCCSKESDLGFVFDANVEPELSYRGRIYIPENSDPGVRICPKCGGNSLQKMCEVATANSFHVCMLCHAEVAHTIAVLSKTD